jgi:curved DNA-binding protein CbpA
MIKLPNYYNILSVPSDASTEQIKRAYKEKALQYHPDINKDEKAVEVFQIINVAYRTLIDPELRRKYDFKMKYGQSSLSDDIRRRHPADESYYQRRQYYKGQAAPGKVNKSIKRLNLFIFYSITAILSLGIIFGLADLFVNFRIGGLLFSVVALVLIFSGVRIINREKSEKSRKS